MFTVDNDSNYYQQLYKASLRTEILMLKANRSVCVRLNCHCVGHHGFLFMCKNSYNLQVQHNSWFLKAASVKQRYIYHAKSTFGSHPITCRANGMVMLWWLKHAAFFISVRQWQDAGSWHVQRPCNNNQMKHFRVTPPQSLLVLLALFCWART